MHIFIKSHFSRSMLRVIEHVPKTKGLGRRKGPKNRWNLDASMHQKFNAKWVVWEAKIQENREKNGSKNHVFFACVFLSIPCAAHVPPRCIVETKSRKWMPAGFFSSNPCTMSKNAAKSEICANIWPTWGSKIEAGAPQGAKKTTKRRDKCSKTRKMRPRSA